MHSNNYVNIQLQKDQNESISLVCSFVGQNKMTCTGLGIPDFDNVSFESLDRKFYKSEVLTNDHVCAYVTVFTKCGNNSLIIIL